tara:strand:- start:299 stop:517 length:219 start_codon:yes stop_codon:yes gene_type:complete
MKSEVVVTLIKKELPFPKLMTLSSGSKIILFTEEKIGTVVYDEDTFHSIGHYSHSWAMSLFIDFTGEIRLKN